jgi:hypothetical protein
VFSVECDPQVGALVLHLADDELAVFLEERVGRVIRKTSVRLEEAADGVDSDALEDRREHGACHAVPRVDDDAERPDGVPVHEGENLVDEGGVDIGGFSRGRGLTPLMARKGKGAVADVEEPGVAAHRKSTAADDLHPVVVPGVVRSGDHDPAVQLEFADGEIEHLGADHPDVRNLGAAVGRPAHHGRGHRGRGDPHVAPDGDTPGLELLDVGTADRVRAVLVQLGRVNAAHVVRLEDLRV